MLFLKYFTEGVFPNPSTNFQVFENGTQGAIVKAGWALVNGVTINMPNDKTVNFEKAEALDRIDRIVLRVDYSVTERKPSIIVLKGEPSNNPVAKEYTRNETIQERVLADVLIRKNSKLVTQAQITDTRLNNDLCGIVSGTIKNIDTTTLYAQIQSDLLQFQENEKTKFIEWFEFIKNQLSSDQAGNLQNQINDLKDIVDMNKINISRLSNPNILINANFSNPVNQRAKSLYGTLGTGSTILKLGYTIDRWVKFSERSSVAINDGYVRFQVRTTSSAQKVRLGQPLEFPKSYAGKLVTLSCEIKEIAGQVEFGLFAGSAFEDKCLPTTAINSIVIDKAGTYSVTATVPENFNEEYLTVMFHMQNNAQTGQVMQDNDYVDICWVKMEYGTVATPFIPRLRGEEVTLCQRFYENFLHSMLCVLPSNQSRIAIPLMSFKVKKRVSPTLKEDGFYSYTSSTNKLDTIRDSAIVNTNGIVYIQLTEPVGATMCYIKNLEIDSEIY